MPKKIRIIVADDHRMVRKSIIEYLRKENDIDVIGEAVDGKETCDEARKLNPDVIVMDISMPRVNGIDATRDLLKLFPDIKVIAFSMYSDKRIIKKALAAGASGFVPKDSPIETLIDAIHTVMQGKLFLTLEIQDMLDSDRTEIMEMNSEDTILSEKEKMMLNYLSEKCTVDEISDRMNIEIGDLRNKIVHLMNKLEIKSLGELIEYAQWEKITV
ncbi:MAG: hypothetical protein A2Y33_10395 [Spirochaetes bacterium GWF1_51_8]|nr:MAG: hypothetical protein A2Y33_10395 [Spirochaetes bacterium GWF1_51_8]